jgi:hypothetical protein
MSAAIDVTTNIAFWAYAGGAPIIKNRATLAANLPICATSSRHANIDLAITIL